MMGKCTLFQSKKRRELRHVFLTALQIEDLIRPHIEYGYGR